MRPRQDLTGRRRGSVTVTEDRGDTLKIRCDCGKEKEIRRYRFYSIRHCGCQSAPRGANAPKAQAKIREFANKYHTHPNILSSRLSSSNVSGVRGVWQRPDGRYVAYIGFNNKHHYLGTYPNIREAAIARRAAENELYGPVIAALAGGRNG